MRYDELDTVLIMNKKNQKERMRKNRSQQIRGWPYPRSPGAPPVAKFLYFAAGFQPQARCTRLALMLEEEDREQEEAYMEEEGTKKEEQEE